MDEMRPIAEDRAVPPRTAPHPPAMDRRHLLGSLLAAGVVPRALGATPGEVPVGGLLRDAPLRGLNGPSRRLAEFRGRPLVINVWASWCGPCRGETASLERLAWSDAARGFAIIGISTDDYADRARAWLAQSNATISHYIDHRLELENLLGASRLPLTVLVGADWRVRAKVYGAREWDAPEAVAAIRRAFATPAKRA
jgi:thiol-disulfide isomerase/thioredoxin